MPEQQTQSSANRPFVLKNEAFQDLLAPSGKGRVFSAKRKVRLGDADQEGRLRLDALTRYTQDVSNDDTTDAGMAPSPTWVVRSTVVDEIVSGQLAETLDIITFCSAIGKRWAERRLSIHGDFGAHYEVATLWVCIDDQGNPRSLASDFTRFYQDAADGRRASVRLQNPKLSSVNKDDRVLDRWQLRRTDYDIQGHVNNAAYWAAVEQWLPAFNGPRRVRLEYGTGLKPSPEITIVRAHGPAGFALWWLANSDSSNSDSLNSDSLNSDSLNSDSLNSDSLNSDSLNSDSSVKEIEKTAATATVVDLSSSDASFAAH